MNFENKDDMSYIKQEISILESLQHDNIVSYLGIFTSNPSFG